MRKGNCSQDVIFVRRVKEKKKKALVALTSLMQDTNGIELDEINTCECTYQVLPESTFFMRALSYSMKCQF